METHASRDSFRRRFERLLRINIEQKPQVYLSVFSNADYRSLNYWLEILLAAGIAILGLVLNSPAVVIGAMLVSPLMGPILGLGLAYAAGDLFLGIRSAVTVALSVIVAIAFAALVVWLLPFRIPTQEILNRTQPNLLDLGVALFSGLAGSLTLARGGTGGGVTALPGVAIAVALMPPLCTVGFGLGADFQGAIMKGALLLFLTNLGAIVFAAFLVFYLIRMDAPGVRASIEGDLAREREADPLHRRLSAAGIGTEKSLSAPLMWRLVMLLVVVVGLAVPLRESFVRLRDESLARAAIADMLKQLVPRGSLVHEEVDLRPERNRVVVMATSPVPAEAITSAEKELTRRTGKPSVVRFVKVASQEEVSSLRQLLEKTEAAPMPASVEAVWKEWRPKLDSALKEVWPAAAAPLVDAELVFGAERTGVRVRYQAKEPLDAAAVETIRKGMSRLLQVDDLDLVVERVRRTTK